MKTLNIFSPATGINQPKISIIVPACNEAETIEPALCALAEQNYPNLEIIAINDRSTDRTGETIERLKHKYNNIAVHHLKDLPAGWLGKNHALHYGAQHASGKYIVFTDADVLFEQSTIARAVRAMEDNQLDHLSLVFKNSAKGGLLNAMILDAGGALFLLFQPWKANKRKSNKFMGVGAFNMVRRTVYQKINGHDSIKLHPIDDIMLGKTIKEHKFRQDCLLGYDFVTVKWYETPQAMINGLMKNIFALYNFRLSYVLIAISIIVLVSIVPLWGLFFSHGLARLLFTLTIGCRFLSFIDGTISTGTPIRYFPWSLLTPYMNLFIIIKATFITLKNKGIQWRGTFYPLDQLKKSPPIL